jgi:CRP/FNR family transcriptional regulator, cyclic AMP receptor protein
MNSFKPAFSSTQELTYKKGQILLHQGQMSRSNSFIISGYVKVYDIGATGNEKLLLLLKAGDIYPLVWQFENKGVVYYFYETITDVTVQTIPRRDFIHQIETDQELSKIALRYFADFIKQLLARTSCLEATNARNKLVQVLDYLSSQHSHNYRNISVVDPPLTHQNIADMAGLTRETTSLQIKALEMEKVIQQDTNGLKIYKSKLNKLITSV